MTGIFSIDFYDENQGAIIGGDWDRLVFMEEYIGQRGEADRVLDHVEFVVVARESLLTILLMSFLISISVFLIML